MNPADSILASLPDAALTGLATAIEAGWLSGSSPDSAFASVAGAFLLEILFHHFNLPHPFAAFALSP